MNQFYSAIPNLLPSLYPPHSPPHYPSLPVYYSLSVCKREAIYMYPLIWDNALVYWGLCKAFYMHYLNEVCYKYLPNIDRPYTFPLSLPHSFFFFKLFPLLSCPLPFHLYQFLKRKLYIQQNAFKF